jgi:hypothetical protein
VSEVGPSVRSRPPQTQHRPDRPTSTAAATPYVTRHLERASSCARALRFGPSAARVAAVRDLPSLVRYLASLPRVDVAVSHHPEGALIAAHLQTRRWGLPRFRIAQGVLHLTGDFSEYLRGRHRQAVRTNCRRARELGAICVRDPIALWEPEYIQGPAAPAERWRAIGHDGATIGDALLIVDSDCALLCWLGARERYVRWLLHTEIVARLCDGRRRTLLTNSYDIPLLAPGQQHFQHLLGYTPARVRPRGR